MTERVAIIDERLRILGIREEATQNEQLLILLAQERLALTKERISLISAGKLHFITPLVVYVYKNTCYTCIYMVMYLGRRNYELTQLILQEVQQLRRWQARSVHATKYRPLPKNFSNISKWGARLACQVQEGNTTSLHHFWTQRGRRFNSCAYLAA